LSLYLPVFSSGISLIPLLDLIVRNGKGVVARIMDVIFSEGLSVANITTPSIVTSDMDRKDFSYL